MEQKQKPAFDLLTLLCGMGYAIMCALIYATFNAQVFQLPTFTVPAWLANETAASLFGSLLITLNMGIASAFAARRYNMKSVYIALVSFPIIAIANDFRVNITFVPYLVLLITSFLFTKQKAWKTLVRLILISLVQILLQEVALITHLGIVSASYVYMDAIASSVLMIDIILFLLGITLIDRQLGGGNPALFAVVIWGHGAETTSMEQDGLAFQNLKRSEKFGVILLQIVSLSVVALVCALNAKFLVFFVLYLFGYVPMTNTQPIKYHAKSFFACLWQSTIFFFVLTSAIPQLSISILIPVVAGALAAYLMSWFANKMEASP